MGGPLRPIRFRLLEPPRLQTESEGGSQKDRGRLPSPQASRRHRRSGSSSVKPPGGCSKGRAPPAFQKVRSFRPLGPSRRDPFTVRDRTAGKGLWITRVNRQVIHGETVTG